MSRRDEAEALAFGRSRPEPEGPALTEDRVREIIREELAARGASAVEAGSDG